MQALPDPHIDYIGPVAVWWVPKPPAPRLCLVHAIFAWVLGGTATAATVLWVLTMTESWWPFGKPITDTSQILLRYELIILVYLLYLSVQSLPRWWRYRRLAKRDAVAIDQAIRQGHWERAGLLLHRYCLLVLALWRRFPGRVAAWDSMIRDRLPKHRRLYLYYHGKPIALPSDPAASFTPAVIPPPQPSWWSLIALIPIAFLLYLLVVDILRRGQWELILTFNVVLLIAILISYGTYFVTSLLGRSHFFRLEHFKK